jgi:hypothetical protein
MFNCPDWGWFFASGFLLGLPVWALIVLNTLPYWLNKISEK